MQSFRPCRKLDHEDCQTEDIKKKDPWYCHICVIASFDGRSCVTMTDVLQYPIRAQNPISWCFRTSCLSCGVLLKSWESVRLNTTENTTLISETPSQNVVLCHRQQHSSHFPNECSSYFFMIIKDACTWHKCWPVAKVLYRRMNLRVGRGVIVRPCILHRIQFNKLASSFAHSSSVPLPNTANTHAPTMLKTPTMPKTICHSCLVPWRHETELNYTCAQLMTHMD